MKNRTNTIIKAETKAFSDLFHEGKFIVPWHQRHYDWKKKHIQELLQDIDEAAEEHRDCYFLGTIMLLERESMGDGKKYWEINDGQQRMVTMSLICAYLCRYFHDQSPESQREGFALRILFDLPPDSLANLDKAEHYSPRIIPPDNNKATYNQLIRGERVGGNGLLVMAWKAIEDFFFGMTQGELERYFDFLINKVEVVGMHIPPTVDMNAIYETINCRGKPLDNFDLIRNHIYSFFRPGKEKQRRDAIHQQLERVRTCLPRIESSSEYMRCLLQCEFGFLRKKSFYNDFRKALHSKKEGLSEPLEEYISKLTEKITSKKCLGLFHFITSPKPDPDLFRAFKTDSETQDFPRNLDVFLRELRDYKISQPLVLSMLMLYMDEEDGRKKKRIAKLVHRNLNRLTTFIMRTSFVTKFEPSKLEKHFSSYAQKITEEGGISGDEFSEFLKDRDRSSEPRVLDDDEFERIMAETRITGVKKTKNFLLGINHHIQKKTPSTQGDYTIEHILPSSERYWDKWADFEGADLEAWVERIGNLTLLAPDDDKPGEKSNNDFFQKRGIYERSSLKITRELADSTEWSPYRIERRQKKIAKYAVQVWKFE